MPNSMMYEEEMYVVLETNQPEQFLSPMELVEKLRSLLSTQQDNLPLDLQGIGSIEAQVQRLIDTACELDLGPDQYLQWYVVPS